MNVPVLQVAWGDDLASEHERYIAEEVYKGPVIVYNYPAAIKSFYMRMNDDGKTVAAMDMLVPGVGELIGGSQREDRLDVCAPAHTPPPPPSPPLVHLLSLLRFSLAEYHKLLAVHICSLLLEWEVEGKILVMILSDAQQRLNVQPSYETFYIVR